MVDSQIDVVYLWCDGNDPAFAAQKQKRMQQLNLAWSERNHGSIRYFDNEELRYSLRSVSKYLPWVNHIYLVTNNQKPHWLIDHPKISIVDHQEIIPKNLLPTFNSVTIEMYLHKIPGLSEKFLFFNDDMFINADVQPEFFFQGDKPIVRMVRDHSRWQFKNLKECESAMDNPEISSHRRSLLKAWYLFCQKRGILPFYTLAHTIDAFTKTAIEGVLKEFPELLKNNVNPFRSDNDIQRLIFQMEMVKTQGCPLKEIQPLTFMQKHFWSFSRTEIESFEGTESSKTWERIRKCKPKMFCVNAAVDSSIEIKKQTHQLLEELFPIPSPYEKRN